MRLFLSVLIVLFLSFSLSTFQQSSTAKLKPGSEKKIDLKEALNGAWQAEAVENSVIRFQDRKIFSARDGNLQEAVRISGYREGEVALCIQGQPFSLIVTFETQRLKINCPQPVACAYLKIDNNSLFKRMDKVPSIVDPQPIALGTAKGLSEARVMEIQTEMARRYELDTGARTNKSIDAKERRRIDLDNTAYLIGLIKEVGWIDKNRFGEKASKTAFLIVQHSGNVPLMMTALPLLKEDGQLSSYALLYDRLQLHLGEKQLYGSQVFPVQSGIFPLEDPENVDKRRKEMGLGPLAEYVTKFGLKEVKILEWNCDK